MSYYGTGYGYDASGGSYYGDPSYSTSSGYGSGAQGYYGQSSDYDSRPSGTDSYSGQYSSTDSSYRGSSSQGDSSYRGSSSQGDGSYRGSSQGGYGSSQGGYDRDQGGYGSSRGRQDRSQGGYDRGQRDQYSRRDNSQRDNRNQDRPRGRGGSFRGGDRGGFKRKFDDRDGKYDNKRNRFEDPEIPEDNWKEKHPLMQSVFMDNAIEGLEQDWLFVICPTGNRRLLVAANDITQTYDNEGKSDMKFNSCLPNGGTEYFTHHKYDDLTVLDTIYTPTQKKFYVIDLVHWKHYPYNDTEAEFRFFILKDKYADLKTPQTVTEKNEYPIELLERTPYSNTNLLTALQAFQQEVEGVLFIKKTAQYLFHDSYDSLWLKLDHMESVLGYPVPTGVEFVKTTEDDIRLKSELKQREKLRAEREEAKERQSEELKSRVKDEVINESCCSNKNLVQFLQ